MVWKAAEGLGADDVLIAGAHQLDHLRRQKPALAHLVACRDDAVRLLDQLAEGHGRVEAEALERVNHHGLELFDEAQQHAGGVAHEEVPAVEPRRVREVVDAVLHEAHEARDVHLAVLAAEEILEVVVAQGRILDVYLADDADLDLRHALHGDFGEVRGDERHVRLDLLALPAAVLQEPAAYGVEPLILKPLRVARIELVWLGLRAQADEHVAVVQNGQQPAYRRERHREAASPLKAREVEADDRDVPVARLGEGLSQQVYVIRGAAAAAGLGDYQRRVLEVVPAGVERVEELAYDEQGGIAGVVVDVFEAQLADLAPAVFQKLAVIALLLHDRGHDAKLHRRHVRNQYLVRFLHLRREPGIGLLLAHCISSRLSSRAAKRLRSLMRTAPRFVISSILSWV